MYEELRDWEGLGVAVRAVPDLGAWIWVALHDDTLGPPTGGTRLRVYDEPRQGLVDALRLARAMTFKWAALELPFGGGKAVLALSRPLDGPERSRLLGRYAELLNALQGGFGTGQDYGTTPEDMALLARSTDAVHGIDPETGACEDPGPQTARGVLAAMRAACAHSLGTPRLAGRRVTIQGTGDVGAPLARLLAEEGARLKLCDPVAERVEPLARELGAEVVPAAGALGEPCEVFAPCAVGGVLNRETIPELRCRIVCGSANDQLATDADADRLHARGIQWVPDFIASGGGAAFCSGLGTGRSRRELEARVLSLESITAEVLAEAAERNESPLWAARRRVESYLGSAKERKSAGSAERAHRNG